jgi:hypothetical protein
LYYILLLLLKPKYTEVPSREKKVGKGFRGEMAKIWSKVHFWGPCL